MPNTIAFLPWVAVQEPLTVGPLRLIPYERGRLPGDGAYVRQQDIDGVLMAYALRKNQLVERASLVELGDWHLGQDSDEQVREKLFRARELIAFAALAQRRLFRGHLDYCNFDTYAFVIQNYHAGSTGTFSFSTRRRDGGVQYLWDADEFSFLKPLHVEANARLKLDEPFLTALIKADDADKLPYEAILEFNRANSDSQDVPTHTETVLTKSAFEYLFGIGQAVSEFVDALKRAVLVRDPETKLIGPLEKRWIEARPRTTRPLEAWAREFCDVRGGAAHGKERGGARFVWSEHAHLAFASILFPLLIKQRLAQQSYLEITERDAIELDLIEAYLMHDPFEPRPRSEQAHGHPWSHVYSNNVLGEVLRRTILRQMQSTDWSNLPPV